MEISTELNHVIMAAYREAESRTHEYLMPEHVLYACLFFDRGRQVITGCGGSVDALLKDLEEFFRARVPVVEGSKPIQSVGFQSMMENAILHTASAEKQAVEVDDMLASLLEEKESFAAHLLSRQGVDRLSLLSYISHGVTAYPTSEEPTERVALPVLSPAATTTGSRKGPMPLTARAMSMALPIPSPLKSVTITWLRRFSFARCATS